jgi:hypothetical protein
MTMRKWNVDEVFLKKVNLRMTRGTRTVIWTEEQRCK